jgi:ATP-dependent DNA helicase RecQ
MEEEREDVTNLLSQLGSLATAGVRSISWDRGAWLRKGEKERQNAAEKALHRLVVLGVVSDYIVDWAGHEFRVQMVGASSQSIVDSYRRYVSRYSAALGTSEAGRLVQLPQEPFDQLVLEAATLLIHFVYTHIEQARRQSLSTMLQAAMATRTHHDLRRRILEYLQQTEWDERLEPMRVAGWAPHALISDLLDLVMSPNDAADLRGATDRMLASYPDAPAILLIRSVSEALCRDTTLAVVSSNSHAAVKFALLTYNADEAMVADTISWVVGRLIYDRHKADGAAEVLRGALAIAVDKRHFLRELVHSLPPPLKFHAALPLNDLLSDRLAAALDQVEGG